MPARSLSALLLVTVMLAGSALADELVVIVHPDREVELTVYELAQIYLKRRRFWKDGGRILPVNRNAGSSAREAFARRVLGESDSKLTVYWNQQYFRGVLPPSTLASDEAVRRFVSSEPLAIGYVSRPIADGSVRIVLSLGEESE